MFLKFSLKKILFGIVRIQMDDMLLILENKLFSNLEDEKL